MISRFPGRYCASAMAYTHDNLDEFFDFAQLEHDNCLYSGRAGGTCGQHAATEDVTAMDWQPAVSDYIITPGELLERPPQEWTWNEVPSEPLIYNDPNHPVASTWPANHMPITNDYQQPPELQLTPLSSSPEHNRVSLISEVVQHGSVSASGQEGGVSACSHGKLIAKQSGDTPVAQTSSHTKVAPPITTSVSTPTRHTSSASWKPASAKRKGPQSRIPLEARQILEDEFATNPYPCE